MTNYQIPQSVGHRQEKANSSLGFGAWSLGFDWDLATWDLVISDSSPPSLSRTPIVTTYRLTIAFKRYLRVHLPLATVFASQLVTFLVVWIALVWIADFSRQV
jgi:hypothetical protein